MGLGQFGSWGRKLCTERFGPCVPALFSQLVFLFYRSRCEFAWYWWAAVLLPKSFYKGQLIWVCCTGGRHESVLTISWAHKSLSKWGHSSFTPMCWPPPTTHHMCARWSARQLEFWTSAHLSWFGKYFEYFYLFSESFPVKDAKHFSDGRIWYFVSSKVKLMCLRLLGWRENEQIG